MKNICKELEFYETPEWAAKAILKKEILTDAVLDPCVGRGRLAQAALEAGYTVAVADVHDWGYPGTLVGDFLAACPLKEDNFTVFMNPPFSLACQFVDKAFQIGARKVVAFQRLAWLESKERQNFWRRRPPNRIYFCQDRATCWRGDLLPDEKGDRFDPETGKKLSDSTTAHAWFVWEPDQPGRMQLGYISKDDAREESNAA